MKPNNNSVMTIAYILIGLLAFKWVYNLFIWDLLLRIPIIWDWIRDTNFDLPRTILLIVLIGLNVLAAFLFYSASQTIKNNSIKKYAAVGAAVVFAIDALMNLLYMFNLCEYSNTFGIIIDILLLATIGLYVYSGERRKMSMIVFPIYAIMMLVNEWFYVYYLPRYEAWDALRVFRPIDVTVCAVCLALLYFDIARGINETDEQGLRHLPTKRGLLKFFLLNIITFGIYGIVVFTRIGKELNLVATPHDSKHTRHYCLVRFLLNIITLGIYGLVWWTKLCARIGNELNVRNINYSFGAGTFWGWYFFGRMLFGIGWFVFYHKFFKAMNLINADFNAKQA